MTNDTITLPPYRGNEPVTAETVGLLMRQTPDGYTFRVPEWVSDLVIAQANISKVTPEGTFAAAHSLLAHLARSGINGLWICPIFENRGNANASSHYGNHGPQTLADDCFRARDPAGKQAELRHFVDAAHRMGIYVFLDVVTYGLLAASPIYQAYLAGTAWEGLDVSDWFTGEALYSGYAFNWRSAGLRRWFTDRMADLIRLYDFDGFRVDSEPHYLWYTDDAGVRRYADIFPKVRLRVAGFVRQADGSFRYPPDARGRQITVFSEKNNLRDHGYDFEQYGVIHYGNEKILRFQICFGGHTDWFRERDLVRDVQTGRLADGAWFEDALGVPPGTPNRFRFYTYCVSNHDYHSTAVNRRLWVLAYQALLAPFLPVWYIGEECGLLSLTDRWLNGLPLDIPALLSDPDGNAFYQSFLQIMRLRRAFPELFAHFAEDVRQANLARVNVTDGLLGYARTSPARTAIVLANPTDAPITGAVSLPRAVSDCDTWVEWMSGFPVSPERNATVLLVPAIQIPPTSIAVLLSGGKTLGLRPNPRLNLS